MPTLDDACRNKVMRNLLLILVTVLVLAAATPVNAQLRSTCPILGPCDWGGGLSTSPLEGPSLLLKSVKFCLGAPPSGEFHSDSQVLRVNGHDLIITAKPRERKLQILTDSANALPPGLGV